MLRSRGIGTTKTTRHETGHRTSKASFLQEATTWLQPLRASPRTKESQSRAGVSSGLEEDERMQRGKGEGDVEQKKDETGGQKRAGRGQEGKGQGCQGRAGRTQRLLDRRDSEVRLAGNNGGGRGERRGGTTGKRSVMRRITRRALSARPRTRVSSLRSTKANRRGARCLWA